MGVGDAMRESSGLVHGHWWWTLLAYFVLSVVVSAVSTVLGFIPFVGAVATIVLYPFVLTYVVAMYFQARDEGGLIDVVTGYVAPGSLGGAPAYSQQAAPYVPPAARRTRSPPAPAAAGERRHRLATAGASARRRRIGAGAARGRRARRRTRAAACPGLGPAAAGRAARAGRRRATGAGERHSVVGSCAGPGVHAGAARGTRRSGASAGVVAVLRVTVTR